MQALGQPLHESGDAHLVDHLAELPGAAVADADDRLAVRAQHRLDARERLGVAAAHHAQLSLLRSSLATRDRRIDEVQAAGPCGLVQLARHRRGRSRVVHEHGVRLHGLKRARVADRHLAHVVIGADTGTDDVGVNRGLARRGGSASAVLGHPRLCPARGAVEDGHVVTAALQVTGHGAAHDAKTDEGDTHTRS